MCCQDHAFSLVFIILYIRQQFGYIGKDNIQIVVDIYFNCRIKGILYGDNIAFKKIYSHNFSARIDNSIFTNPIIFIIE